MNKECSYCKKQKPTSEFGKCKTSKDGLYYSCKECRRKQSKRYREENPEKVKNWIKNWKQRHPDKQKEYNKKFKENNPERHNELNREGFKRHRENNPEKYRSYARKKVREYYKKDIQRSRERGRDRYYREKAQLSDNYVKSVLCDRTKREVKFREFPDDIVELTKLELFINRKLKRINQ